MELISVVTDFARCLKLVDEMAPQAVNARSKKPFQPGIGPHTEGATVELVTNEMMARFPAKYGNLMETSVPYPDASRQKCDLCIGQKGNWEWAIEVKMLRILGDNGKPNDNILMHILSPYIRHRSAVTDCEKLTLSPLGNRNAIMIYGYEAKEYPLEMAIDAFEVIAGARVHLSPRMESDFANLIHPVHSEGKVYGWEILPR